MADLTLGGRLEIAMPFKVETQGGVGALVGGNCAEDLRGVVKDGLVRHETSNNQAEATQKCDAIFGRTPYVGSRLGLAWDT
ncbi:MAG: hypothetical protein NTV51_11050 [Verrucomicrobia bacterium]|nr:hypothetical protein [Verrucomicrobiota bacterium]